VKRPHQVPKTLVPALQKPTGGTTGLLSFQTKGSHHNRHGTHEFASKGVLAQAKAGSFAGIVWESTESNQILASADEGDCWRIAAPRFAKDSARG